MFPLQYFQVQAEDPDAGQNGTVVYKIGANTGPFQINPFSELILHVVFMRLYMYISISKLHRYC